MEQVREWLIDLQLEQYSEACQLTGEQMLATSNAQFEKVSGTTSIDLLSPAGTYWLCYSAH